MSLKRSWSLYRRHLGATMGAGQVYRARGAALVVVACMALAVLTGCSRVATTATGPESEAVADVRAVYKLTRGGTTITEFTLTDGTPCVKTGYREVVTCGWGLKWGPVQ